MDILKSIADFLLGLAGLGFVISVIRGTLGEKLKKIDPWLNQHPLRKQAILASLIAFLMLYLAAAVYIPITQRLEKEKAQKQVADMEDATKMILAKSMPFLKRKTELLPLVHKMATDFHERAAYVKIHDTDDPEPTWQDYYLTVEPVITQVEAVGVSVGKIRSICEKIKAAQNNHSLESVYEEGAAEWDHIYQQLAPIQ